MAFVMAGGRGTRMGAVEKPLILICGKPIIERIIEAVNGCDKITDFYVVLTASSQFTSRFARKKGWKYILTGGRGYLADAWQALEETSQETGLFVSSDLPFLTSHVLAEFLDRFRAQDAKVGGVYAILADGLASPAGINILRVPPSPMPEFKYFARDLHLLNMNTPQDVCTAKRLCECKAYSGP